LVDLSEGVVHGEAGGREQADGSGGDQVEVQAEDGGIYPVRLEFEEWGSAEFYAWLQRSG